MSTLSQVNKYIINASCLIERLDRAPTRAEYAQALDVADAAMELAMEGRCDADTVNICRDLQQRCQRLLRRSYSNAVETHDRFVYDKTSARGHKRCGKVYGVDKGEHLVDAIRAVHVGQLLEDQQRELVKKIRFVDEVGNQPIQQVYYIPQY